VLRDEVSRADRSIKSAAAHGVERKCRCESGSTIRAKNRFWRAAMRREANEHENFFIAKNRDSESAQRAFGRLRSVPLMRIVSASSSAQIAEVRTVQVFLAISTNVCVVFFARCSHR
jgi:hypothetical protein